MFTSTEYSFFDFQEKNVIHDPIINLVKSSILNHFAHEYINSLTTCTF